jgi:hypothetical protein
VQGFAGNQQNKFCQKLCGDPARIDLLFTMSEIPQSAALVKASLIAK